MISARWALILFAIGELSTVRTVDAAPVQEAASSVAPVEDHADDAWSWPEPVSRVSDWIVASNDNGALPYAIIDKVGARLYLFDSAGTLKGDAPVLAGVALGDEATPGIGGKSLAEIGPAEKTTPAGRFIARYGAATGGQRVLWVDYGTSVALHPIPKGTQKERRRERLLSETPEDNRITFGCINVPLAFYQSKLRPMFRKNGGVVYILPDTKTLEAVFPRLHAFPVPDLMVRP